MFSKADKKLFKIVGLLFIPSILVIPFGDFGLFITFLGIPLGILFGWALVNVIDKWREK